MSRLDGGILVPINFRSIGRDRKTIDPKSQDAGIEPRDRSELATGLCVRYRHCTYTCADIPGSTSEGLRTDDIPTRGWCTPPNPPFSWLPFRDGPISTQICGSFSDSLIYFREISLTLTFLCCKLRDTSEAVVCTNCQMNKTVDISEGFKYT